MFAVRLVFVFKNKPEYFDCFVSHKTYSLLFPIVVKYVVCN